MEGIATFKGRTKIEGKICCETSSGDKEINVDGHLEYRISFRFRNKSAVQIFAEGLRSAVVNRGLNRAAGLPKGSVRRALQIRGALENGGMVLDPSVLDKIDPKYVDHIRRGIGSMHDIHNYLSKKQLLSAISNVAVPVMEAAAKTYDTAVKVSAPIICNWNGPKDISGPLPPFTDPSYINVGTYDIGKYTNPAYDPRIERVKDWKSDSIGDWP